MQDQSLAYYTVVGPTDNLYEDVKAGNYEMVPLRALDTRWEAGIC